MKESGVLLAKCCHDVRWWADRPCERVSSFGGLTASLTMSAFTPSGRKVRLMGSRGYLEGNEHAIRVLNYESEAWTGVDVNTLSTDLTGEHGGATSA